jgi:hypothetical protein
MSMLKTSINSDYIFMVFINWKLSISGEHMSMIKLATIVVYVYGLNLLQKLASMVTMIKLATVVEYTYAMFHQFIML